MWKPASSTPRHTSQGYQGGCAGGRTSISLSQDTKLSARLQDNDCSHLFAESLSSVFVGCVRARVCVRHRRHTCETTQNLYLSVSILMHMEQGEVCCHSRGSWLEAASGTLPDTQGTFVTGSSGLSLTPPGKHRCLPQLFRPNPDGLLPTGCLIFNLK